MRLATLVDLELDVGMAFLEVGEQVLERGGVGAGEERDEAAGLGEQPFDDGLGDLVERVAAGDRLAVLEPEPAARPDGARA